MKRNIYFIAIFFLMAFTACKKFLTTTPSNFLTPDQYYTGSNLTNSLAGVYNGLYSVYGEYVNGVFACTDETLEGGLSRQPSTFPQAVYAYDYTSGNVNNVWRGCYTGIERANELLTYIDQKDTSAGTQAIYGEALFLRAYYHFLLVSNFGAVPLKITPTTSPDNLNIAPSSIQTIYNQVVKDMKTAEAKVYPIDKFGNASRVTKSAVDGILARVYLNMAGYPLNGGMAMYDSSRTYSQKVINSGLHSLNPSYSQVFINMAADVYEVKESIWEIDYVGNDGTTLKLMGPLGSQNGIGFTATNVLPGSVNQVWLDSGYSFAAIYVTKKLYDLYDNYDARRDWNVQNFNYTVNTSNSPAVTRTPFPPIITSPFNYYRTNAKWRRTYEVGSPKSKNQSAINFPVLRYSDVLLMFAEADLQLNGGKCSEAGLAAVNAVRERGYGLNGSTAPLKSLTITNPGSGYNTVIVNNNNNASLGDINLGNWLGYASTITGGQVTNLALMSGGVGFNPASAAIITLGTPWTANTSFVANQQVYYKGNLYTVPTAGISNSTPPTHTSGSSTAASTGIVFNWAGTPATAQGTLLTSADVDLTTVTLQDIQNERSRELCYEGLRKSDLVRWNIFYSTMVDVNNQINAWGTFNGSLPKTTAATGYSNVAYSLPVKHLLLPIPISEISVNKSITQNPGW